MLKATVRRIRKALTKSAISGKWNICEKKKTRWSNVYSLLDIQWWWPCVYLLAWCYWSVLYWQVAVTQEAAPDWTWAFMEQGCWFI